MIQEQIGSLLGFTIQIHLLWFLFGLFLAYQMGYYQAKRKFNICQECWNFEAGRSLIPLSCINQIDPQSQVRNGEESCLEKNQMKEFSQPEVIQENQNVETSEQSTDNSLQLLKERLEFGFKKIKSRSFLEIRVEPSSNTKFMRKIQKHELVTDYEMQNQQGEQGKVVSFNPTPVATLSEPHSFLQVVAHQDHNNVRLSSPMFQRRFINANHINGSWKQRQVATWLTQTGRFHKFFRKHDIIGKGGFGSVFKSWSIFDQKEYAIKKIVMKGEAKLSQLLGQVNIISKYNHPNIVMYHTCWIELANLDQVSQAAEVLTQRKHQKEDKDEKIQVNYLESDSGITFNKSSKKSKSKTKQKKQSINNQQLALRKSQFQNGPVDVLQIYTLHIQMELCQKSLFEYLRRRQKINPVEAFQIFTQIINGIRFLHSNGIVHRDLKPANILVGLKNNLIKIGDFGLATLIETSSDKIGKQKVGTPHYMAPQLNNNLAISKQNMFLVDIFSLGVIYFELINMFHECTQHERHEKINALQINTVQIVSKQFKQQKKMIKLLTKSIATRPTINEILHSKEFIALKNKYQKE